MAQKRIVRRTVAVLLSFVGLLILLAVGAGVWALVDVYTGASAASNANIQFTGPDGRSHAAFLARPGAGAPDRTAPAGADQDGSPDAGQPAVLLLHEWWGLNGEITEIAELLAAEGYIVLAPDAFRGSVAESVPGALFQVVTTPGDAIARDLDAAYTYLESLPGVDESRIAAVGFCFGGTQAFLLGTRVSELASLAVFYGSGLPTDPEGFGALQRDTPVLGIFGRSDSLISVERVRQFEAALNAYGVPNTVTLYRGVGHAFVGPESVENQGAAEQAWAQLKRFLDDTIGS